MKKVILYGALIIVLMSHYAFAAHPLVTDDTGTQGAGKVQVEITGEYLLAKKRLEGVTQKINCGNIGATITVGAHQKVDVIAGIPFQWFSMYEDGALIARESGVSDASFDIKWRFFELDGWSLAIKPGALLPTGDYERGLGAGRVGYRFFLIGTKETAPWAFHANAGYIRNESFCGEEKNIWHVSAAAEYEVIKDLKLVGNIGIERNRESGARNHPVFALAGAIYQIGEQFSVDAGIKIGLTKQETYLTFLTGVTMKF